MTKKRIDYTFIDSYIDINYWTGPYPGAYTRGEFKQNIKNHYKSLCVDWAPSLDSNMTRGAVIRSAHNFSEHASCHMDELAERACEHVGLDYISDAGGLVALAKKTAKKDCFSNELIDWYPSLFNWGDDGESVVGINYDAAIGSMHGLIRDAIVDSGSKTKEEILELYIYVTDEYFGEVVFPNYGLYFELS